MSALMNHTIGIAHRNGYGRCGAVPVWTSALHNAGRVVLILFYIMDERNGFASALAGVIEMAQWRQQHWQEAAEMGLEVDAFRLLPAIMDARPEERGSLAGILQREIDIVERNRSLLLAAPKLLQSCEATLPVMKSEKAAWVDSCDLFDNAIELCEAAIADAEE